MNSKLYGKTIIWNGDSICAGKHFDDTKEADAWAGRIAEKYSMTYKNYAVGGGTIAENVILGNKTYHSVSGTLDIMKKEFPNADYVIIEGGTNDADLFDAEIRTPERIGSFSPDDYSGNYDRNTFCGALESCFYRVTQYWKGAKIGYVVAHKMGPKPSDLPRRRKYFEKAIEICKKWGVPVTIGSDAHFMDVVGQHEHNEAILKEADFPMDLVMNTSAEKLIDYLKARKARLP